MSSLHGDINKIIKDNTGLIYFELNKFHLVNDPEAISIAYEALFNAICTFDDSKVAKLSTYATVCIYNALGSYLRTINRQRQIEEVSYHNELEDGSTFETLLGECTVEECVIKDETKSTVTTAVNMSYKMLDNPKHKEIVIMWIKSEYTISTTDIAKETGVSQSYVSQVLNKFKYSLRKRLEGYVNA